MEITKKKHKDLKGYFTFTPKQMEAYQFIGKGKVIFYGGARGGGKTHLARASAVLVAIQKPGIKICLIRKTYSEVVQQFKNFIQSDYPSDVFQYTWIEKDKKFRFVNGSEIYLRSLDKKADIEKIQGVEYGYIIIDEANQYDKETIEDIRGSLRNARIPNWESTMLMTGNPGGRSDHYFRTRFVHKDLTKWEENEKRNHEKYTFVSAKVDDNPYLGEDYKDSLMGMRESRKRAWLEGEWDAFEGKFFEMFDEKYHVVDDFEIPADWIVWGGLDLGFSRKHPTVCLWVAQDPETENCYVINEYINTGVVEEHAVAINSYADRYNYPLIYADPSIFKDKDVKKTIGEISTSDVFMQHGVFVMPAENSRIDGWRHLKQWLSYIPGQTLPRLRFFKSCLTTIENMPLFRYNPRALVKTEDLDTDQAYDDIADALRYVMKSAYNYPINPNMVYQDGVHGILEEVDETPPIKTNEWREMDRQMISHTNRFKIQYHNRYR